MLGYSAGRMCVMEWRLGFIEGRKVVQTVWWTSELKENWIVKNTKEHYMAWREPTTDLQLETCCTSFKFTHIHISKDYVTLAESYDWASLVFWERPSISLFGNNPVSIGLNYAAYWRCIGGQRKTLEIQSSALLTMRLCFSGVMDEKLWLEKRHWAETTDHYIFLADCSKGLYFFK